MGVAIESMPTCPVNRDHLLSALGLARDEIEKWMAKANGSPRKGMLRWTHHETLLLPNMCWSVIPIAHFGGHAVVLGRLRADA